MPERSSSIRMSRRSSLAGFRRSVTENPETSELLPTQWEGGGLDAICILVGPKMSDPPLEGGVVLGMFALASFFVVSSLVYAKRSFARLILLQKRTHCHVKNS